MPDSRRKAVNRLIRELRVTPGKKFDLEDRDTAYKPSGLQKKKAPALLAEGVALLEEYQDRLYAEERRSVLFVLQAIDAAGKDGTIKHVMSGVNPQGVDVSSFKVPSKEELDHDFLWRCAKRLPQRGRIGIFNRSYYEEVIVTRVHPEILGPEKLPTDSARPPKLWRERYRAINEWERYLTEQGTTIVKVFLHVSKDEQARRFLARIDNPAKNWKFSSADMAERQFWGDYQRAYTDMLSNTSTTWAPWYVVPADRKWFARLSTAAILIDALMGLNPQYPDVGADVKAKLAGYRDTLLAELPAKARQEVEAEEAAAQAPGQ